MCDINKAAFMTEVKKIELKEIPMPEASQDSVVIKVEYIGVCGSDAHFFETGIRKGKPFDLPFVLGHECAGTIVKTGSNVNDFKVGDRVCIEPQITCGKCIYCKSGRYNLCQNVKFPSVPPYDGLLRNYAEIPASQLYKLPDNVSTLEGALIEPLAVGLSAAEKGNVSLGKSVVILGAGSIGLMTLLACRAMGATKIIISDLFDNRLDKAKELGADIVINAGAEDVQKRVYELTDGMGADIVFETAGSQKTAASTVSLIKSGGVIVLVGNINGETPYPFMDLMYKEGEIRTIYRYKNNFQTAISAVSQGIIDVKPMISHQFDFSDVQRAFEYSIQNKQDVIKAVIKI